MNECRAGAGAGYESLSHTSGQKLLERVRSVGLFKILLDRLWILGIVWVSGR